VSGPLSGLRVLDLGTRIAAPFCAGLLAEQGAEVVKIEQPGTGDFMREIGPFVPPDQLDSPSAAEQSTGYSLFWAVASLPDRSGRRPLSSRSDNSLAHADLESRAR